MRDAHKELDEALRKETAEDRKDEKLADAVRTIIDQLVMSSMYTGFVLNSYTCIIW